VTISVAGRFIQKEQLGLSTWSHQFPFYVAVTKRAGYPALELPITHHLLWFIM
jgi:hypothetical protein